MLFNRIMLYAIYCFLFTVIKTVNSKKITVKKKITDNRYRGHGNSKGEGFKPSYFWL